MMTMPTRALLLAASATLAVLSAPAGAAQLGAFPPAAPDVSPPAILAGPTFAANPNPRVPLAATISLRTNEETQVELAFKDGERSWSVLAGPEWNRDHAIPVLQVRPNRTHEIAVVVRDKYGNTTRAPQTITWTTPALPALFPPLQTTVSQPHLMEPGVVMFNATNSPEHPAYMVIVDQAGDVVWFYESTHQVSDARRLRNGNFLYMYDRFYLVEVDAMGDVQNHWFAAGLYPERAPDGAILVDCDTFHHEVSEMPASEQADFVVLSSELRTLPDYPSSETDPTQTSPTADVIGDVVIEFDRAGNVLNRVSMFDVLDPYRVCYNSLGGFWNGVYLTPTRDWTHGNAVIYHPYERVYVLSLRSQDAVVKIRRDSGELVWIMGAHERWVAPWSQRLLTPVGAGPFEWQYHQHAPEIGQNGEYLLFDNGNGRAIPPAPELPWADRYSRAVRYRVDEQAMTIEQMWDYGGLPPEEQYYSKTRGDADRLPETGNVLVTDSDRLTTESAGTPFARIVEVRSTVPPQVVFEQYVRDQSPVEPRHWTAYRSEKLSSVYPHL